MAVSAIQASSSSPATATADEQRKRLQQAAGEVVGSVFFAPMLKMAREDPLKGKYGHGGRGEEIFGAQLDMELAQRASHRLNGGLTDALVNRLARKA